MGDLGTSFISCNRLKINSTQLQKQQVIKDVNFKVPKSYDPFYLQSYSTNKSNTLKNSDEFFQIL